MEENGGDLQGERRVSFETRPPFSLSSLRRGFQANAFASFSRRFANLIGVHIDWFRDVSCISLTFSSRLEPNSRVSRSALTGKAWDLRAHEGRLCEFFPLPHLLPSFLFTDSPSFANSQAVNFWEVRSSIPLVVESRNQTSVFSLSFRFLCP